MQASTKILLLIGTVALLALGVTVALAPDPDLPVDLPMGRTPTTVDEGTVEPDPGRQEGAEEFLATAESRPAKPLVDPAKGLGMISGRIAISTTLLGKLSRYAVVVQEYVNTNGRKATDPEPYFRQVTFPYESKGSPYFDIEGIPFSRHPYQVSVIADGANGSSDITSISAESPLGSKGDVQLALTPGAYYSIRLRDQRQVPRGHLPVRMSPVGESLVRRDTHIGESDGNGHVLFENVLKGDYEIRVGPASAPLAPPEKVTVYATFTKFSQGRPQPQGTTLVVPDGHHVTIEIVSAHGFPVENATLKAWQLEVQRYYDFEGKTDRAGQHVFQNVPYGVYQLRVETPHNGTRDLKFKVEKDQPAPIVNVEMPR